MAYVETKMPTEMQREDFCQNLLLFIEYLFVCTLACLFEHYNETNNWILEQAWVPNNVDYKFIIVCSITFAIYSSGLIPNFSDKLTRKITERNDNINILLIVMIAITCLCACAGLERLFTWFLILHHIPDLMLNMIYITLSLKQDNVDDKELYFLSCIYNLMLIALIPIWFLLRGYYFATLLNPHSLLQLPNGYMAYGLITHVLLWVVFIINIGNLWTILKFSWSYYVIGDIEDIQDPFALVPNENEITEEDGNYEGEEAMAKLKSRENLNKMYHAIKTIIRLKRKIKRRREEANRENREKNE